MSSDSTQEKPQSFLVRLAGDKAIVRFLTRINVILYRWSGGRIANKVDGSPVCLVTMTGHRSGKRKTIALMYTADEDKVLLVASLGGAPRHPVWYHNLKAQPEVLIQVGSEQRRMIAREASKEEKSALWPRAVASFPAFAGYQAKTSRDIPVFVCAPA